MFEEGGLVGLQGHVPPGEGEVYLGVVYGEVGEEGEVCWHGAFLSGGGWGFLSARFINTEVFSGYYLTYLVKSYNTH